MFAAVADVMNEGGRATVSGDRIVVRGARSIEIRLNAATGFRGFDQSPDLPIEAIEAKAVAALSAARGPAMRRCGRRMSPTTGHSIAGPDCSWRAA
ncbi:hypothetical protein GCM10020258_13230 [Sphingomonas yabuuchiae]